ncbi:hypothetical protein B0H14DRAFT_2562955 [Mycena olivaceomarginata]|nr:hypothetical protein B0H14DRAFT_2562955 [Mycena olivaceomarginata]
MSNITTMQEDPADNRGHPRTSTPPRGRTDDETVPGFEVSTEFEDVPLRDYNGPVEDTSVDTSVPVVKIDIKVPTLRPLSKIGNNSHILARRAEALTNGATGIGKEFLLDAPRASRRLFQHVFPRELELLDTLLSEVERLEVIGIESGYRVIKDQFRLLLRILQKLRTIAEDSFRIDDRPDQVERSFSRRDTEGLITKATLRFGVGSSNNNLPRNNKHIGEVLNPMAQMFEPRREQWMP